MSFRKERGVQLERRAIDGLVEASCAAVGLTPRWGGPMRQINDLAGMAIKRGRAYQAITTLLTILQLVLPFAAGQSLALIDDFRIKVPVFVVTLLVLAAVVAVNHLLPRNVTEQTLRAELLKSRLVIHRLAGQLGLHNFIQKISSDDDEQMIEAVSKLLDHTACNALKKCEDKILPILKGRNQHVLDSRIEIDASGIGDALNQKLNDIAASVDAASGRIFHNGDFVVKIYLRTSHTVSLGGSDRIVKLLTSVARHPQKPVSSKTYHGKSWIDCRGERSDVWLAHDTGKVAVYQRVKNASEDRIYQSIACIPMLDGLGVITIESQGDPHAFEISGSGDEINEKVKDGEDRTPLASHVISDELHMSIAVAVKDLVVRAVRAEIGNEGPGS